MSVLDLIKATVVCGLTAFLVYTYPVVAQGMIIGIAGIIWLFCAHQAAQNVMRRRSLTAGK